MGSLLNDILCAARADSIPEAQSGLWRVNKIRIDGTWSIREGKKIFLPAGTYTYLHRYTDSTLHVGGETVMEDTPFELRHHLNFMLRAKGNVLITGLGLGCVVRGLLVNPRVEHITCLEISKNVIDLVEPYMPKERLKIIHTDALKWTETDKRKFHYAWHDIWADPDNGQDNLNLLHAKLLMNCQKKVEFQGAWHVPRWYKKIIPINYIGKKRAI